MCVTEDFSNVIFKEISPKSQRKNIMVSSEMHYYISRKWRIILLKSRTFLFCTRVTSFRMICVFALFIHLLLSAIAVPLRPWVPHVPEPILNGTYLFAEWF